MESFIDVSNLTYCGKEGQEIFSHDIFDLDLRGYGITYLDGVKGKQKLYSGEVGDVWQAYTCAFTPEGEVVLSEDFIEPVAIKVNMEECYDKFWPTYLVEQTEISLHGGIPQTFGDWFFAKLRDKMKKEYQEIFWKGDTAYTGTVKEYLKVTDGIEAQLEANTATTKITGSTFTVANAISQVEGVILSGLAKAADAEVVTDGYKVFMNYADVKLLEIAISQVCCTPINGFGSYGRNGNGNLVVDGFEVVPTVQSRGTVIFGPARNLVLGFDTFDSHVEYRFISLRETTGDNAFRIIAISNIAVGIVFPELFVYSRP